MKPIIALNLKTYIESSLKNSVKIAKAVEKVARKYKNDVEIILAPNIIDISVMPKYLHKTKLFSQHVDASSPGRNTGKIVPYYLKKIGVSGSIVNHSEHRIPKKEIEKTIDLLKNLRMESLVCVRNVKEAKWVSKLNPTYVAFEDPKLIATGISISKAEPKSVERFVKVVKKYSNSIPLCGAGISNENDVKRALELGTKGVLIASAFVKSKNKKMFLEKIIKTIKMYNR